MDLARGLDNFEVHRQTLSGFPIHVLGMVRVERGEERDEDYILYLYLRMFSNNLALKLYERDLNEK